MSSAAHRWTVTRRPLGSAVARDSTIDLVFASPGLLPWIDRCTTDNPHQHGSDHLAVVIQLRNGATFAQAPRRRAWKTADFPALLRSWEQGLQLFDFEDLDRFPDPRKLDLAAATLSAFCEKAASEAVPYLRPSKYSKPWWSKDLEEAQRTWHSLQSRWENRMDGSEDDELRRRRAVLARRRFRALAVRAELKHVNDVVNDIRRGNKWKVIQDRGLRKAFFPTAVPATLAPKPPPSVLETDCPPLLDSVIADAFRRLRSNAGAGADGHPPSIVKKAFADSPLIRRAYSTVFRASARLGVYPTPFKDMRSVVISKPRRPDYTATKAYRPIGMQSSHAKPLDIIMGDLLLWHAKKADSLPSTQCGGRPGYSVEDVLLLVEDTIKAAWRKGHHIVAVFVDADGTLNRVVHHVFARLLEESGILSWLVRWFLDWLTGRRTRVELDGQRGRWMDLNDSIPQGWTSGNLAFSFYTHPLFERSYVAELVAGYVDDITPLFSGKTVDEAVRKADYWLRKSLAPWEDRTGQIVSLEKTHCIIFSPPLRKYDNTGQLPTHRGHQIASRDETTLLGVHLTKDLSWKKHMSKISSRGGSSNAIIGRIARRRFSRRYLLASARALGLSHLSYASTLFFNPTSSASLGPLASVQGRIGSVVVGAAPRSSHAAINVECGWLPLHRQLALASKEWYHDMRSKPLLHPLRKRIDAIVVHIRSRPTKVTYLSALYRLAYAFDDGSDVPYETIDPLPVAPWTGSERLRLAIAEDRDAAAALFNSLPPDTIKLYTDGSEIAGHVGAGSVLVVPSSDGTPSVLATAYRIPEPTTVYGSELVSALGGFFLAVGTIVEQCSACDAAVSVVLLADNQAALTSIFRPSRASGQSFALQAHQLVLQLLDDHPHLSITLQWLPGHSDFLGNSLADAVAKMATAQPLDDNEPVNGVRSGDFTVTEGAHIVEHSYTVCSAVAEPDSSAPAQETHSFVEVVLRKGDQVVDRGMVEFEVEEVKPVRSVAVTRRQAKELGWSGWVKEWQSLQHGADLRQLVAQPTPAVPLIYDGLSRADSVILSRLRIGKAGFNSELLLQGRSETSNCPSCGLVVQDRDHFLLRCHAHRRLRSSIIDPARDALGSNPDLGLLLTHPEVIPATLRYVVGTERWTTSSSRV